MTVPREAELRGAFSGTSVYPTGLTWPVFGGLAPRDSTMRYSQTMSITASQVRADLVRALEVDLIGPSADDEKLDRAPSRFYLTGFLVPREGRGNDLFVEPEDDTESEDAEAEDDDAAAEDARPAGEGSRRRSILPASMGISVLLPPGDASRFAAPSTPPFIPTARRSRRGRARNARRRSPARARSAYSSSTGARRASAAARMRSTYSRWRLKFVPRKGSWRARRCAAAQWRSLAARRLFVELERR